MDVRSQLKRKEDKIRAYYSRILNPATDAKIITTYARKSYKIQKSRKAAKGGAKQVTRSPETKKASSQQENNK